MVKKRVLLFTSYPAWRLALKVILIHFAVVSTFYLLFKFQSCRKNEPEVIRTRLVTLPPLESNKSSSFESIKEKGGTETKKRKEERKTFTDPPPKNRVNMDLPNSKIKFRTPEEIRKSSLVSPNSNFSGGVKKSFSAPKKNFQSNVGNRLAKIVSKESPSAQPQLEWQENFGNLLIEQIHRQWEPPRKTEVSNLDLTVTIKLRIYSTGKILEKKITKPSENVLMNTSVARLLRQLDRFPPFPGNSEVDSITQIIDLKLIK